MSLPAEPCPENDDPIRTAAWNAVAVASIAHREALDRGHPDDITASLRAFRTVLTCARSHDLQLADLCAASGLDDEYLLQLEDGTD